MIEQLPGAPVESVGPGARTTGASCGWQKGDTDKALADYTQVIEQLPGAPVEQVALALDNSWPHMGAEGRHGQGSWRTTRR